MATGVFDVLHIGHLRFLDESKKRGRPGAKLVVVVARDRTVLRRKGRLPVMPENQRREMVAALKPVDRAILGHKEVDFLGILQEVKPDIVCVGHDQNDIKGAVKKIIEAKELPIKVIQIARFGPRDLDSSSKLKLQVVRNWRKKKG